MLHVATACLHMLLLMLLLLLLLKDLCRRAMLWHHTNVGRLVRNLHAKVWHTTHGESREWRCKTREMEGDADMVLREMAKGRGLIFFVVGVLQRKFCLQMLGLKQTQPRS